MKRIISILMLAATIASLAASQAKKTVKLPEQDIVILYTNDVHCGIEDNIGYAGLSLYKQEMSEQTPYVSLVDAGDAIQGATIGMISKGGCIISLMNELGYDVVIPGNHEFDYGMKRFLELSKKIQCGYIACNFRRGNKLVFPAYKMISYGKTKVAYVGIVTPETISKSTPVYFQDDAGNFIYDFGGENNAAKMISDTQQAIDAARKKGADYVVLVAHLGENGVTPEMSAPYLTSHISGADVVIDGHSHEVTPVFSVKDKSGREIPITQSGTKLSHIGKVTISKKGIISTELVDSVPSRNGSSADKKIQKSIADMKENFSATVSRKIGETDFPLLATDENNNWLVRDGETNLCDFIADAYREILGADICVINGGSVRSNIPAGVITYNNILNVNPFDNLICVAEVKGQTLIDELEFGARQYPKLSGGILHCSGLSYKIDPKVKPSIETDENMFFLKVTGPYRVYDVTVNGKPIDPEKIYTVAGIEFTLFFHGDGHMFYGAKRIPGKIMKDRDILIKYTENLGGKLPEKYRNKTGEGRLIIREK